ncbi:MAG TPA: GNAT family N-acetyltransferase [Roseiarcus sp.]|nr:GNAT family N-acetyltransferase [Roseiarcus sp.]
MSAERAPPASLRPYLPSDAALCAEIFRSAIEELTGDDYDEAQREAWASRGEDVEAFGARLAGALTLVALVQGGPVGFASLKGETIDMLFVAPAVAGRGIGAMLLDALVKLAGARGVKKLTSEVSDTAKPTFERQGFAAERRNIVRKGDQWLANTTMVKTLAGAASPGEPKQ